LNQQAADPHLLALRKHQAEVREIRVASAADWTMMKAWPAGMACQLLSMNSEKAK
jgi:hypothetical protein